MLDLLLNSYITAIEEVFNKDIKPTIMINFSPKAEESTIVNNLDSLQKDKFEYTNDFEWNKLEWGNYRTAYLKFIKD